jgi:hypothetical protein
VPCWTGGTGARLVADADGEAAGRDAAVRVAWVPAGPRGTRTMRACLGFPVQDPAAAARQVAGDGEADADGEAVADGEASAAAGRGGAGADPRVR